MARQKRIICKDVSPQAYQQALSEYAAAEAEQRKIHATIDVAIVKIRDKHKVKLESLTQTKGRCFDLVQTYCTENQQKLFANKRSIATAFGTLGFRLGTPKLKTLKGFTWAKVLTIVKQINPAYIRTKEEINKEAVLMDKDKLADKLKALGMQVAHDESFYINIKEEENE